MTQSTNPSKGSRLTFEVESTFGTQVGSGQKDVRVEGNPDGPLVTGATTTALQPQTLFADAHEFAAPVQITAAVDGVLTMQVGMHQAAAVAEDSFLSDALESMGLTKSIAASDTTTTGTPAVGAIDLTADNGAIGRGCYISNNADSDLYIPVLAAGYATQTITPAMDIKAAPAASQVVIRAATFSPGSPKATSTSLTFEHDTQGAGSSNKFEGIAEGCALANVAAFEIVPNVFPFLNLTFNGATLQSGTIAALGANSFQDSASLLPVNPATFYCEFATAATAGGITRAVVPLLKATVDLGWSAKSIPGFGGATCFGGIQGYFGSPTDDGPSITMEMLWDVQMITDWEASTVEKHIAFVQPSASLTNLGWSFTAPSCRQISQPVIDHYSEGFRKVTVKYKCGPAGFNGTGDGDAGNQPWYWIIPTSPAA